MSERTSLPRAMVWQIFKKDWKLLWPLFAAIAAGQVLLAALELRSRAFVMSGEHLALVIGLVIAMGLLIMLAVHQDAIPGANQDWLARPIKRRDLLLAKLLLVALLIHGPIIANSMLRCLGEGFSFSQSLHATLLSTFEAALVFSLPLMALAALTKTLTEAAIGSLAIFLGLMLVRVLISATLTPFDHADHFNQPTDGTGVAWVWLSLSHVLLLTTTVAVLLLQYFRRSTASSRLLFIGGLLLYVLTPALPWEPAFAIQQSLSASSDADHSVSIAFDPTIAKVVAGADAARVDSQLLTKASEQEKVKPAAGKDTQPIFLPLRFSGLPAGLILHADHSAVRLLGTDGQTLYRGIGHVFDLPPPGSDGQTQLFQTIQIPTEIVRASVNQTLRLELDYSLTLLRSHPQPPLPALNGDQQLPAVGRCTSRIDDDGTAIEVSCRAAQRLPPCISMAIEQAASARRNPEEFVCALNYEPPGLRFSFDPVAHSKTTLPFHHLLGTAPYAVDDTRVRDAQVVLSVYEPESHFTRRIVIQNFRPRDWQSAPPSTSDKTTDSKLPESAVQH